LLSDQHGDCLAADRSRGLQQTPSTLYGIPIGRKVSQDLLLSDGSIFTCSTASHLKVHPLPPVQNRFVVLVNELLHGGTIGRNANKALRCFPPCRGKTHSLGL
jgi:hypothetical protein